MKKVAVIGIGHVGSTVAYTLIARQLCDTLVLFDKNEKLVEAEKNDLTDGQVGRNGQVKILTSDLTQLSDCDLVIFAAGDISILQHSNDRFDELTYTKTTVEEWAPKLKAAQFKGVLLNITNPCDVITQYFQQLTGFEKHRVIGTGTTLDTARMQVAVGHQLSIDPNSVQGYVLGEHGNSQFVAWSGVRLTDQVLADALDPKTLSDFAQIAKQGAWDTISGKGYTSYGIANQANICAEAILKDMHQILPVSNYSTNAGCYMGHPAVVTAQGVKQDYHVALNAQEQVEWQASADTIKKMFATIKEPITE